MARLTGSDGAAAVHRGTERYPEISAKESAANNMGIGLIVQRIDRHVGMLSASRSSSPCEG